MSYFGTTDWYQKVSEGLIPGYEIIHKFGAGTATTTLEPVTYTGTAFMPTTAQAVEFVSTSANDTVAGTGARTIAITYTDTNWSTKVQTINTNGTTAVPLPANILRLLTWKVATSGSYASTTVGSHAGALTLQLAGGGTVIDTIPITPFPAGRSEIGVYTIPANKEVYLQGKVVQTDSSKYVDVYFFVREDADIVTAPYGAMTLVEKEVGIQGGFDHHFKVPKFVTSGPADVGFMAKTSTGTAAISVEFEMILKDI